MNRSMDNGRKIDGSVRSAEWAEAAVREHRVGLEYRGNGSPNITQRGAGADRTRAEKKAAAQGRANNLGAWRGWKGERIRWSTRCSSRHFATRFSTRWKIRRHSMWAGRGSRSRLTHSWYRRYFFRAEISVTWRLTEP